VMAVQKVDRGPTDPSNIIEHKNRFYMLRNKYGIVKLLKDLKFVWRIFFQKNKNV